jgi:hypothetical protein
MEKILIERKERLQQEIEVAQKLLHRNISDASLKDYLTISGSVLPGIINGVIENPSQVIANGDMLARNVLPADNMIRRILKFFSLIARGLNLITK